LIYLNKGYIMLAKIHTLSKDILQNFQSLSLLLARLAVAYGFLEPALNKWSNMKGTADFFGSIGIPFPMINAYMAATTELLGVILLTIGLLTRLISVPLMVVMIVAITTVHLGHGFSAGNNGFEIPLYYFLFLFIFTAHGAGKFSLDHYLFEKEKK